LAKRLTEKQKAEIIKLFTSGTNLEELSKRFCYTKLTISRNLKKILGEKKYIEIFKNNKADNIFNNKKQIKNNKYTKNNEFQLSSNKKMEEEYFSNSEFVEIEPLNCDFENNTQKDLTSVHISKVTFPKMVYMIVDKKVELETKYLKDYPEWQFLSQDELKRKTIEIYFDLKVAKNYCGKEQKIIKVPNTDVFKKAAPILISKGISRIISSDKLIAL
tara:strand:- start:1679 stop:2329 length:651 start_codon:yes stop_codon:yes gene_type:complete